MVGAEPKADRDSNSEHILPAEPASPSSRVGTQRDPHLPGTCAHSRYLLALTRDVMGKVLAKVKEEAHAGETRVISMTAASRSLQNIVLTGMSGVK